MDQPKGTLSKLAQELDALDNSNMGQSEMDQDMASEFTDELPTPSASTATGDDKKEDDDEIEFIEEVTRLTEISSKQTNAQDQQVQNHVRDHGQMAQPRRKPANKNLRIKNSETEESNAEGGYHRLQKELNRLQFANPGEAMVETSLAELSQGRRLRRRADRTAKQNTKPQQRKPEHDREGKFVRVDGSKVDICDCIDPNCKGCFWPCPNCKSRMCGFACRNRRKWTVERIELPGAKTEIIARHPYLPEYHQ